MRGEPSNAIQLNVKEIDFQLPQYSSLNFQSH